MGNLDIFLNSFLGVFIRYKYMLEKFFYLLFYINLWWILVLGKYYWDFFWFLGLYFYNLGIFFNEYVVFYVKFFI